jgi:hypothetical protein
MTAMNVEQSFSLGRVEICPRQRMDMFLGFDPGGAGAFGWCVLVGTRLPLQLLKRGVAHHAI